MKNPLPYLGFGLGLRPNHYESILHEKPAIDWFEVITENYFGGGGQALDYLERIRATYPIVMHGVSLSLGSAEPLDMDYLKQVKALALRVEPSWISDHVCWTKFQGRHMHDLLPLPYTEQAIAQVVTHIQHVQDYLGRQILIENVSSYLTYQQSEMTEWAFLSEILTRADCFLLLDVNNVYVSAFNHAFDAEAYLAGLPAERIQQIHLAGHSNRGTHIIDTHDAPVIQPVWDLYAKAIARFGKVSTMIERDDDIPDLQILLNEVEQARTICVRAIGIDKEVSR